MIGRSEALEVVQSRLLDKICSSYNFQKSELRLHPGHEGCQNIIFFCSKNNMEYVIRVSFRDDRSFEEIVAETHFINYLYANTASVSNPIRSQASNFVEKLDVLGRRFYVVAFNKAKGIRLPDNNYQYRDGISIDEYYHDYGKTLGKMHRLTKNYLPPDQETVRPAWLANMKQKLIPRFLPEDRTNLMSKIRMLCDETESFPKDRHSYGLIHADFGDGNFAIDYNTGNITVFDFDDCAYNWFMYDLADAWTKGVGWAMFETSIDKRKDMMNDYFGKVLAGYYSENSISDTWLEKLPFFIRLVEMEWVIGEFQYMLINEGRIKYDEEILYKIKCIEEDIPYLGFFDKIYSPQDPFCLT